MRIVPAPARRTGALFIAARRSVAPIPVLLAAVAMLVGTGALARAEEAPRIGGTVPSTLGLAVSAPSVLTRTSTTHGQSLYTATVTIEVTATDPPTRLTITDGETTRGKRRGHMVRGTAILTLPLQAATAANHGPWRSLDRSADTLLWQWKEPLASAPITIRLRQATRGASPPAVVHKFHKLLLVTIATTGP